MSTAAGIMSQRLKGMRQTWPPGLLIWMQREREKGGSEGSREGSRARGGGDTYPLIDVVRGGEGQPPVGFDGLGVPRLFLEAQRGRDGGEGEAEKGGRGLEWNRKGPAQAIRPAAVRRTLTSME